MWFIEIYFKCCISYLWILYPNEIFPNKVILKTYQTQSQLTPLAYGNGYKEYLKELAKCQKKKIDNKKLIGFYFI